MEAASAGSLECIKILLKYGANMNATDNENYTALSYCIDSLGNYGVRREPKYFDCAMYLIRNGANPNYSGRYTGKVILHFVAAMGDIETVQELVEEFNATVWVYDDEGKAPSKYASWNEHFEVVEYLDNPKFDPGHVPYPNKFKWLAMMSCVLFCVLIIMGILLLVNVIVAHVSVGILLVIIGCICCCITGFALYVDNPTSGICTKRDEVWDRSIDDRVS